MPEEDRLAELNQRFAQRHRHVSRRLARATSWLARVPLLCLSANMPRDEFRQPVKNALALRAAYICSFPACDQHTVGPSDESETASANIGEAAHIAAASEGGRRFDASMSPEERSSIGNGIWLCRNHAALIDRDERTYTVAGLQGMKEEHETRVKALLAGGKSPAQPQDLIALGPDVVVLGKLLGGGALSWEVEIQEFVIGGLGEVIAFCEVDPEVPRKKYVLVNELGDGRVVSSPPSWRLSDGKVTVMCPVEARFPRESAQDLGTDLKLGEDNDLHFGETVSGVEAFPQRVKICLSSRQGEWFLEREFGTRLAEYCELFGGTDWLAGLLKLEVIRSASIPAYDDLHKTEYTPMVCVEKVRSFELLQDPIIGEWNRAQIDLEVNGMGPWSRSLDIFLAGKREGPPSLLSVDDFL